MTMQTELVLRLLMADPSREWYGLELGQESGLPSGTYHPILHRLEADGWLESRWEELDGHAEKRPRRRYYRLTRVGVVEARCALAVLGRPAQAQPRPPENVRLQLADGRVLPLEIVYCGQRDGIHEWEAVWPDGEISRAVALLVGKLPAYTAVSVNTRFRAQSVSTRGDKA